MPYKDISKRREAIKRSKAKWRKGLLSQGYKRYEFWLKPEWAKKIRELINKLKEGN